LSIVAVFQELAVFADSMERVGEALSSAGNIEVNIVALYARRQSSHLRGTTSAGIAQFCFHIHSELTLAKEKRSVFAGFTDISRQSKMEHKFEPLKNDLIIRTAWGMLLPCRNEDN
jgi:hypothetical protein